MRLALVTHNVTVGDGQGRVVRELALHAARAGLKVTLLADTVEVDLLDAGLEWLPVRPRLKSPNLLKVRQFADLASRCLRRERRWELIHAHGYVLHGPHHVNTAHFVHGAQPVPEGGGPRATYRRLYRAANARWERGAFAEAAEVVAVSQRVRDELTEIDVDAERVTVIPNGVHPHVPQSAFCRVDLGLPHDRPLALFAGDLRTPRKNLDTVLNALAKLPTFHLAVAGDPNGSPYPLLAEKLGVADRVTWLGFRKDLPSLYGLADLFLCPSRYEPFSLVLLEALAAGTPVVTSSRVGAAGLVDPQCAVVVQDPENAEALCLAWARLWEQVQQEPEAVKSAAQMVAARNSWERMGEAYLALYRTLGP